MILVIVGTRSRPPADPASWASSEAARRTMRGNRSKDTRPEVAVRSALHRAGLRFRKHFPVIPGSRSRVDVAFPRWRVAVQVDGCFWHGCPDHGTQPVTHAEYWTEKIRRNVERDRRCDDALAEAGWTVLRFWEHEETAAVVTAVQHALKECSTRALQPSLHE